MPVKRCGRTQRIGSQCDQWDREAPPAEDLESGDRRRQARATLGDAVGHRAIMLDVASESKPREAAPPVGRIWGNSATGDVGLSCAFPQITGHRPSQRTTPTACHQVNTRTADHAASMAARPARALPGRIAGMPRNRGIRHNFRDCRRISASRRLTCYDRKTPPACTEKLTTDAVGPDRHSEKGPSHRHDAGHLR
jgi:hypothetical protein